MLNKLSNTQKAKRVVVHAKHNFNAHNNVLMYSIQYTSNNYTIISTTVYSNTVYNITRIFLRYTTRYNTIQYTLVHTVKSKFFNKYAIYKALAQA